jgi:hypothetical protein
MSDILRSRRGVGLESLFGYPVRQPFAGEEQYFAANPTTAGMAADDDKIVLNPYSPLPDDALRHVAANEAARIFMRSGHRPDFDVTTEQRAAFSGTPYGADEQALRETLAARLFSGDPSAGAATPEQAEFVTGLRRLLEMRR